MQVSTGVRPEEDGKPFGRFLVSSLASSVVDLGAFAVLCELLREPAGVFYVTAATIAARVLSSLVNYLFNYSLVFHSSAGRGSSAAKYAALTAAKTMCSALLVSLAAAMIPAVPELAVKLPVDVGLFFVNYLIQKRFVY